MDELNPQNIPPVQFADTSKYDGGNNKKKIIVLIVIILVAIGLAVGSILLIRKMMSKDNGDVQQTTSTQDRFDQVLKDTYDTDKDFDGILDEDEKKYGTSVTSSDTDADGLLDDAEINRYKTDPTKADTDGDGFNDGYEVRRGFNPNGTGTL